MRNIQAVRCASEFTKSMELLLRLLFIFSAVCYAAIQTDLYNHLFIDCGASMPQPPSFRNDSYYSDLPWHTDQPFTYAGRNFVFNSSGGGDHTSSPMNSLRFFPSGSKNCYDLPCYLLADSKFLFRAGFYYGNYDGLSRPPRFKLTIDGNLWTTVETSMSGEPFYYELIYTTRKPGAKLCLESTEKEQVPFISSTEVFDMGYYNLYNSMENHTALFLHSRINYGTNQTVEKEIRREERFGRIWKSMEMREYVNIHADHISTLYLYGENWPPSTVMGIAIQAQNSSSSINLPVNFSNNVTACFVLYFDTIGMISNTTSSVDIYINRNKLQSVDIPSWLGPIDEYKVVTLYPVLVNGSVIVTISPANGTKVAPFLNAMEVFSVLDVTTAGTLVMSPSFVLLNLFLVIVYWYVLAP